MGDGFEFSGGVVVFLSYSTPELTDALVYGIEGKDYEIKDGRTTIKPDFWARFLGNSLITTPCFYEPQNRAELLQEQLEWETESPILGFYLDITKMKEDWVSVVLASWDHEALYSGVSEDIEAEIEQARKDLKEAGLERVLEEIDRQLEEWQKEKEE